MTPDRNPWLESLIRPNVRPYSERAPLALESVARLLERLGNPHRRLRVIHIAGSKGKGSTALMTEALLEVLDYRTGVFTSPHLERWTERFRIGGKEITQDELDQAIAVLRPPVDHLTRAHPDNPPSFFDVLTTMALWLFQHRGVDVAVIETGIGGRFDATNIVRSEVACITNIELEHTDKLGTRIAAIAAHKAGIIKPGAAAVVGALAKVARIVVCARLNETRCGARWLGRNFDIRRKKDKLVYTSRDPEIEFRPAHIGRHMMENAALALACVQSLNGIESEKLKQAAAVLETISLPGRTEILRTAPWWVVDAAHTRRSVAALAETLDALPAKERHFIVSLSGDKSIELLTPLLDTAASIIVTSPEPLRSTPAAKLASEISTRYPDKDVEIESDVASALNIATSRLKSSSLLCATGSTYLAGAARRLLLSSVDAGTAQAVTDRHSNTVATPEDGASPSAKSPALPESEGAV